MVLPGVTGMSPDGVKFRCERTPQQGAKVGANWVQMGVFDTKWNIFT